MADLIRWRFSVRGRVQGVGFRWFTRSAAADLGVVGWVVNAPDGSVVSEAQGAMAQMEAFAVALRQGPRFSVVDSVDVEEVSSVDGEAGFEIRR